MLGKQEIKAFLDGKKIAYEWAEHEAVYTIEDMVKLGLEDMQDVAKNLFLRDAKGKRHFLVVVREDKKVDLKRLGDAGEAYIHATLERGFKTLDFYKGLIAAVNPADNLLK